MLPVLELPEPRVCPVCQTEQLSKEDVAPVDESKMLTRFTCRQRHSFFMWIPTRRQSVAA
jgi:hypothetical protein